MKTINSHFAFINDDKNSSKFGLFFNVLSEGDLPLILYLIKVSSKSKTTVRTYEFAIKLSKNGTFIGKYSGTKSSSKSRYVSSFISFIFVSFTPNTLKQ